MRKHFVFILAAGLLASCMTPGGQQDRLDRERSPQRQETPRRSGPNCKKGQPCGNSCISWNKTCRK